jgi:hypothetical protein
MRRKNNNLLSAKKDADVKLKVKMKKFVLLLLVIISGALLIGSSCEDDSHCDAKMKTQSQCSDYCYRIGYTYYRYGHGVTDCCECSNSMKFGQAAVSAESGGEDF